MTSNGIQQGSSSIEVLQQQNQSLQEELMNLKAENQAAFTLLVDTTRRLQATSTSIKAAVSSLLNYDILWDAANQHEFLETIDISVDLLTHLVTLLALRFRMEAGELDLMFETHSLQEIISAVQVKLLKNGSHPALDVSFISGGKLVLVDYNYLIASLELLIGAISSRIGLQKIRMIAEGQPKNWLVSFIDIDPTLAQAIQAKNQPKKNLMTTPYLSSETILKLYTALDLLHVQDIQVDLLGGPDGKQTLQLSVPVGGC
jgi:K+-sensing histidine kinase KdpD